METDTNPTPANQAKYVLFRVGEARYALPAGQVREIAADLPRFPVPFTPVWVRGVLNRQGEPYALLDIQAMLGGGVLDAQVNLMLNLSDDQVALLVSDVLEIVRLPEENLHPLSAADSYAEYFSAVLQNDAAEYPVLDLGRILKRLVDDVAAL